jgi:hypothetical protein
MSFSYVFVSAVEFKEATWLLMLIPFGIVLSTGIFFIYHAVRRSRSRKPNEADAPSSLEALTTFRPSLFEQPCRWLAVKSRNPSLVQAALNLHHTTPCSWEEGLAEARQYKLFVSPCISGWVLVVGVGLPEPADDVDVCYRFLTSLSRKLGHVQFFSVNRPLSHHSWALLEYGRVYRGYSWTGATGWNQGPMTSAEKDLEITCFTYAADPNTLTANEGLNSNCDKISQLAGRWSLDPSAVPASSWKSGGIVGELSHSRQR